jgi:hypothetical protein
MAELDRLTGLELARPQNRRPAMVQMIRRQAQSWFGRWMTSATKATEPTKDNLDSSVW